MVAVLCVELEEIVAVPHARYPFEDIRLVEVVGLPPVRFAVPEVAVVGVQQVVRDGVVEDVVVSKASEHVLQPGVLAEKPEDLRVVGRDEALDIGSSRGVEIRVDAAREPRDVIEFGVDVQKPLPVVYHGVVVLHVEGGAHGDDVQGLLGDLVDVRDVRALEAFKAGVDVLPDEAPHLFHRCAGIEFSTRGRCQLHRDARVALRCLVVRLGVEVGEHQVGERPVEIGLSAHRLPFRLGAVRIVDGLKDCVRHKRLAVEVAEQSVGEVVVLYFVCPLEDFPVNAQVRALDRILDLQPVRKVSVGDVVGHHLHEDAVGRHVEEVAVATLEDFLVLVHGCRDYLVLRCPFEEGVASCKQQSRKSQSKCSSHLAVLL